MRRFSLLSICLLALCLPQAQSQETHLSEQGSGAIFSRSAFAHGYRHGYEEGYHLGNIDANFAHLARTKKSQFHGLRLGYSSGFGSKKSFEEGFQSGVLAGYGDGYAGRNFRAVDSMRTIAISLEEASAGHEQAGSSFDQGVASGYRDGLRQKEPANPPRESLDFHNVGCVQRASEEQSEHSGQGSYCEGYRRGFVLGHGDALVLTPGQIALEASK
jgi:flagellar biosynthesis/type III secretory pathway protein FliH